jgi:hypothetical protein
MYVCHAGVVPGSVRRALTDLPRTIARAWNWKAAVLSAIGRASLFFLTNLPAGVDAAVAAAGTEIGYRLLAAGFYGTLTERFARLEATRGSTVAALIVIPGIAHAIEYLVHRGAGTAMAGTSVLVSIAVSIMTTRLNLFAMRQGLLVVDGASATLRSDLRAIAACGAAAVTRRWRTMTWQDDRPSA